MRCLWRGYFGISKVPRTIIWCLIHPRKWWCVVMLMQIFRDCGDMKILKTPFFSRSRIGFVVTFSNCPLLWISKLQTHIYISVIHSKYLVLNHSVREWLPLKIIIKEGIDKFRIDIENMDFVSSSTVYEVNNGAIVFATSPRKTPTSNHVDFKYPWFG